MTPVLKPNSIMNPPPSHSETPRAPKRSLLKRLGAGSLSISLTLHLLLLAAGVVWVFKVIPEPKEVVWNTQTTGGDSKTSESMATKQRVQLARTNMPKVVAREIVSEIVVPEVDNPSAVTAMASLDNVGSLGSMGKGGKGSGPGIGIGDGPPGFMPGGDMKTFKLISPELGKRCSKADRLARLKENGGNEACEDAVVKSLLWLKDQQNPDGSWGTNTSAAMTGFALLAYFGHCETPESEVFGESCMKGIVYLVNLGMKNDGRIATNFTANHWSYEHAIATYALGEALTFCKQARTEVPYLAEITTKAGQYIIDQQNQNGGWAYLYATEGGHTDVSVAGWQIQALKACSHTGIKFRGLESCIGKGLSYINECQNPNGGYGYNSSKTPEPGYFTLTGVGMLCNQMWDKGNRSEVRKAAKYVLENTRFDYNSEFCDLYGHYYESQAMMQRGGSDWKQYNDLFRDQLLHNQDADGSWKTPGGGKKPRATAASWQGDKLYRTCLATLMLEVYYRFLNTGGHSGRIGIQ
jgi:hypothetical protein